MSRKYKFRDQDKPYFVSFATVQDVCPSVCQRMSGTTAKRIYNTFR